MMTNNTKVKNIFYFWAVINLKLKIMNSRIKLLLVLFFVSIVSFTVGQTKQKENDFVNALSGDQLVTMLDGTFTGSAYQYNVNEAWTIDLVCENNTYYISYPTYGCSGYWELLYAESDKLVFKEIIDKDPENICVKEMVVHLRGLRNSKLFWAGTDKATIRNWVVFFYNPSKSKDVLSSVGGIRGICPKKK
jgi:hypothetical protein